MDSDQTLNQPFVQLHPHELAALATGLEAQAHNLWVIPQSHVPHYRYSIQDEALTSLTNLGAFTRVQDSLFAITPFGVHLYWYNTEPPRFAVNDRVHHNGICLTITHVAFTDGYTYAVRKTDGTLLPFFLRLAEYELTPCDCGGAA